MTDNIENKIENQAELQKNSISDEQIRELNMHLEYLLRKNTHYNQYISTLGTFTTLVLNITGMSRKSEERLDNKCQNCTYNRTVMVDIDGRHIPSETDSEMHQYYKSSEQLTDTSLERDRLKIESITGTRIQDITRVLINYNIKPYRHKCVRLTIMPKDIEEEYHG